MDNFRNNFWSILESMGRFSPQWHRLLQAMSMDFVQNIGIDGHNEGDRELIIRIQKIFSAYVPENYYGAIDVIDDNGITGWVKYKNSDEPILLNIYCDNELIGKNIPADIKRNDLSAAGIGTGSYGFQLGLQAIAYTDKYSCISVFDTGTEQLINFRFFLPTIAFTANKLQDLISNLAKARRLREALTAAMVARDRYPQLASFAISAYRLTVQLKEYALAGSLAEEIIAKFPEHAFEAAILPALRDTEPENNGHEEALKTIYKKAICPVSNSDKTFVINALAKISRERDSNIYASLLDNFIRNHVQTDKSRLPICDLIKDKMAFVFWSLPVLHFWYPVIDKLPEFCIELIAIVRTPYDNEIVDKFKLHKYKLHFGLPGLPEYRLCMIDVDLWAGMDAVRNSFKKSINIFFIHSNVGLAHRIDQCSLYIVQTERHCHVSEAIITKDIPEQALGDLARLPVTQKTELAYTGPYQIGKYLSCKPTDKPMLKKMLAKSLQCDIDMYKPLIFFIEEKLTVLQPVINSLNMLSGLCTIIFKPYHACDRSALSALNSGIILFDPPDSDLNLPRFAADFVLAGFRGGSCFSSLLLGLPVLPYYTSYLQSKVMHENGPKIEFADFITRFTAESHPLYYKFFTSWPYLFNIEDIDSIRKAIFEPDYLLWYQENIADFQKALFGDYMLEGSDVKTAEYIMRFINSGTLGQNATSFKLK